jgi:hypothetical protein
MTTTPSNEYRFRHWLYDRVPGLKEAYKVDDYLTVSFMLRDWAGQNAVFAHKELILDHGKLDWWELFRGLVERRGGVWCGGASHFFAGVVRAFPGLHCARYNYGYSAENITHMTTLIGFKDGRIFNLDCYLGYQWEDASSGELLDFADLLRRIKAKEYASIRRVDVALPRPAVATLNDNGRGFKWLYRDGIVPQPTRLDDRLVFLGATPSFEGLFRPGSNNRERAEAKRGAVPFEHFMLDLMLCEIHLTRFAPSVSESSTEYKCLHHMLKTLLEP